MIKKTEKFQNTNSSIGGFLQYFYNLLPIIFIIIYLFTLQFFPNIALIINSIFLTNMLYMWYRFETGQRFNGDGIFLIFLIPPIMLLTILEILLLVNFFFFGKKAKTEITDND
jgi:hypothetical protein